MNPFKTKKGLGRGLSSLIGDTNSKTIKNKLSISSIVRNKFQPRKNFNKEKIEEITNSIRERGILQPIIVRKSSDHSDKFEIIAGERRWQAAQYAGLHDVHVRVLGVCLSGGGVVCSAAFDVRRRSGAEVLGAWRCGVAVLV